MTASVPIYMEVSYVSFQYAVVWDANDTQQNLYTVWALYTFKKRIIHFKQHNSKSHTEIKQHSAPTSNA
jgi:hypothetical protein